MTTVMPSLHGRTIVLFYWMIVFFDPVSSFPVDNPTTHSSIPLLPSSFFLCLEDVTRPRVVSLRAMEEKSAFLERATTESALEECCTTSSTLPTLSRRSFVGAAVLTMAGIVGPAHAELSQNEKHEEGLSVSSSILLDDANVASSVDYASVFRKAGRKALGGGKAGASAAVLQVLSLMWLRTSMNYQYRYGGSLPSTLGKLWEEGGIPRFYRGLPYALVQGPLSRFGDTAANAGILTLLSSLDSTADLPLWLRTLAASLTAGAWRIAITPIDTCKTVLQVEGRDALTDLLSSGDNRKLYRGALASAAATAAGHYPWYLTFNALDQYLPVVSTQELWLTLGRSALLGLSASCVSDCVSNSLRVLKTTQQTSPEDLTYKQALDLVLETDGITGLLGRGLQTRLLTNMIQGAVFSVLWKYFLTVGATTGGGS